MMILTNEQARRFRNALEDTPGMESVARMIGEAVARGDVIMVGGLAKEEHNDQEDGA